MYSVKLQKGGVLPLRVIRWLTRILSGGKAGKVDQVLADTIEIADALEKAVEGPERPAKGSVNTRAKGKPSDDDSGACRGSEEPVYKKAAEIPQPLPKPPPPPKQGPPPLCGPKERHPESGNG